MRPRIKENAAMTDELVLIQIKKIKHKFIIQHTQ